MKLVHKFHLSFLILLSTLASSQSNQPSCQFGQFVNSLGKCMECLSSCPICKSLTQICKNCTQGMRMENNVCSPCNVGQKVCEVGNFQCVKFYTKEERRCIPSCTVKSCKKCESTTSTVCENCVEGFNLSPDKKQCSSNKRLLEQTREKNFTVLQNNISNVIDEKTIIIHQNNKSNMINQSIPNQTNSVITNSSLKSVSQNSSVVGNIPATSQNSSSSVSESLNSTRTTQISSGSIPVETNSTMISVNHTTSSIQKATQINSTDKVNQTFSQTKISQNSTQQITSNTNQPTIPLETNSTNSSTLSNLTTLLPTTLENNSSGPKNETIPSSAQKNQTSIDVQKNFTNESNPSITTNQPSLVKDCGKDSLLIGDKCQRCNLKCGLCINTPNQCLQCSKGHRKLGWKCMRTESIKFALELEKKKNLTDINLDIYNITNEIVSGSLPASYKKEMSSVTLEDLKQSPMILNISGYVDCKLENCSLTDLQNHINKYLELKKSLNNMKINSVQLSQNVDGKQSNLLSKVYSTPASRSVEQPKKPSQQTKVNPAAIVLPIVLGSLFLALIIGCFICYYYKKCCFKAQPEQATQEHNQNQFGSRVDTQRYLQRNKKTPTEIELDAIPDYNKERKNNERFDDEKIQQFRNMESDI